MGLLVHFDGSSAGPQRKEVLRRVEAHLQNALLVAFERDRQCLATPEGPIKEGNLARHVSTGQRGGIATLKNRSDGERGQYVGRKLDVPST